MDVMVRRKQGLDATDVIRASPALSRAINAIGSGEFSPDDPSRFESIAHALRHLDHYMVSADFDSYYAAQRGIDARWQTQAAWTRASILNVAPDGLVLVRSHHRRICRGYLERAGERTRRRSRAASRRRKPSHTFRAPFDSITGAEALLTRLLPDDTIAAASRRKAAANKARV